MTTTANTVEGDELPRVSTTRCATLQTLLRSMTYSRVRRVLRLIDCAVLPGGVPNCCADVSFDTLALDAAWRIELVERVELLLDNDATRALNALIQAPPTLLLFGAAGSGRSSIARSLLRYFSSSQSSNGCYVTLVACAPLVGSSEG